MEFCEFCGSILNEDGSCPWEDCPTNAILEVLNVEEDEEIKKEPTVEVTETESTKSTNKKE